jgi:chromosome segregation ATPase
MLKEELIRNANNRASEERRLKEETDGKLRALAGENDSLLQGRYRLEGIQCKLQEEIEGLRIQLANAESRLKQARNTRASQQTNPDRSRILELQNEIASWRTKYQNASQQHSSAMDSKSSEISRLMTQIDDLQAQIDALKKQNSEFSIKNNMLESEISKVNSLYKQNLEALSVMESQVSDLNRNNNILVNQLSEFERLNAQLKEKINNDLLPKIQLLEN